MKKSIYVLAALAAVLVCPAAGRASLVVGDGFDVFATVAPTTFAGVPFEGVELGTFTFDPDQVPNSGDEVTAGVGNASTIIHRKEEASVANAGETDTIPIEMLALQLKSVVPVDFGPGEDYHYITLQSGTPSTGHMDITFVNEDGGTFDSSLDVAFDVRLGALDGQIIMSDIWTLTSDDVPWDRTAPEGAVLIPGINDLLNGVNTEDDHWTAVFTEEHPSGAKHSVEPATPEPTSLIVWSLLAAVGITVGWWRRRKRV